MDLFNISEIEFNSWQEEELNALNQFEKLTEEICQCYLKKKETISNKILKIKEKKGNLKSLILEDLTIIRRNNQDLVEQSNELKNKIDDLNENCKLKSKTMEILKKQKQEMEMRSEYLQNNMLNLLKIHLKTLKLYQLTDLDIEITNNEIKLYFLKSSNENYHLHFSVEKDQLNLLNSNPPLDKLEEISKYFNEYQDTQGIINYFYNFVKQHPTKISSV